jgi:hypothetical protein
MNEILFCLKKDEAYYFILNEFSYEFVPAKNGKPIKRLIHVDDQMPMDDMTALIDRCLMFASIEHGVFIPNPDKLWREKQESEA